MEDFKEFKTDEMVFVCEERLLPIIISECNIELSKTGILIRSRNQYSIMNYNFSTGKSIIKRGCSCCDCDDEE